MMLKKQDFITAIFDQTSFYGRNKLYYTKTIGNSNFNQDQQYPPKSKLNWYNPIVGVAEYGCLSRLQFISDDNTRSKFADGKTHESTKGQWNDKKMN